MLKIICKSERSKMMKYSSEVESMCPLAKGAYHGPAPIPQEGKCLLDKAVAIVQIV